LDDTRSKLENARLRATMNGIVVFVEELKKGDHVEPFQIVVSVADPSEYILYYQISDPRTVEDVEVGMQVSVSYGGEQIKGSVVQTPSTAPFVEDRRLADLYTKRLYIRTEESAKQAEFGAFADIEIITQQRENVLMIPKGALRTYLGRNYVQVLDGDSRKEADVQTGLVTDTEVEIVAGLKEGQQVIM
jgi:primosomal protein N'